MHTPSTTPQSRQPQGVPGGGQFTGHGRADSDAAPLRLAPSPAAVAALAKRKPLATAPKPEPLPTPVPNYTVELKELPARTVDLGHGIDLDTFAGMYPDMDVWTWDDDGEVVDFDPRTADGASLGAYTSVISNGYQY